MLFEFQVITSQPNNKASSFELSVDSLSYIVILHEGKYFL